MKKFILASESTLEIKRLQDLDRRKTESDVINEQFKKFPGVQDAVLQTESW
jgi:hypothetical protein